MGRGDWVDGQNMVGLQWGNIVLQKPRKENFPFRKEWLLLSNAVRRLNKLKAKIPIWTRNTKDRGKSRSLEAEKNIRIVSRPSDR